MTPYKLFTDKAKVFECNVTIDGAKLSSTKARLVLETSTVSIMFNGSVGSDGVCKIPIAKLSGLLSENTTGKLRLEIIADDTYFEPYTTDFVVGKKITVEVADSGSSDKTKTLNEDVKPKPTSDKPSVSVSVKPEAKTLAEHVDGVVKLFEHFKVDKLRSTKTKQVYTRYFEKHNIDDKNERRNIIKESSTRYFH